MTGKKNSEIKRKFIHERKECAIDIKREAFFGLQY